MLRITTGGESQSRRLKLEGSLSGAWVAELKECWRKLGDPETLTVDLTDVEYVDNAGRFLLALMQSRGADFVAATPLMTQLVAGRRAVPVHRRRVRKTGCALLLAGWITLCTPWMRAGRAGGS
jgi:hypothetical protein